MSKKKNKTSGRTGQKSPVIVKNKVILEKITFRGEKITRENLVKEWNIPKIITSDVGFQLMFGFSAPLKPAKSKINVDEVELNINLK